MNDCPLPSEDLLHELFLLTPAEARVARRLSCGEDLGSIAKDLGVTRGTLRQQLKMLFWKTATHRQGELIALLAQHGLAVEHAWGGTAGRWARRPLELEEIEAMVVARRMSGDA